MARGDVHNMRAVVCQIGFIVILAGTRVAAAQRWQDATANCLGTTAEWSSKIEVADLDGDGNVDILVPNGGDYDTAGAAEPVRIWKNLGNWSQPGSHCTEISNDVTGGFTGLSRMIKVADVDGDGDLDILTGGAYQTQLKLFLRTPTGWVDASDQLPQQLTSIGDAEFGDVDGDGDLDIVLAEWGATSPGQAGYPGGRTRLYLNDGTGHFTDVTATQMPDLLVKWSWDIEFVDVDNDFDLDILVSSKLSPTSYLFRNDGTGHFTNQPDALPHFTNNYEFEPMDIDNDGFLDLITINDGANDTEHIFHNRGDGTYADETSTRLTGTANPANVDDNAAVWLDVDADGDADLLIASLSGPERLLLNDGSGHFTLANGPSTPDDTPGSLGIAVADLDGDGRLDVVQSQGEVDFPEKVQLATSAIAIDTVPPVVSGLEQLTAAGGTLHARVHDHQSPSHAFDWQRVWVTYNGGTEVDMKWYGEYLWSAPLPAGLASYQVCAKDRRGNQGCSAMVTIGGGADFGDFVDAGGPVTMTTPKGCGCRSNDPGGAFIVLVGLGAILRPWRARHARR
jgi:hypothetical protein